MQKLQNEQKIVFILLFVVFLRPSKCFSIALVWVFGIMFFLQIALGNKLKRALLFAPNSWVLHFKFGN